MARKLKKEVKLGWKIRILGEFLRLFFFQQQHKKRGLYAYAPKNGRCTTITTAMPQKAAQQQVKRCNVATAAALAGN